MGHNEYFLVQYKIQNQLTLILGQLLIGIDQYVAVVNPLHYHRNVNEFRCKMMCLSAWIVSICLVILTSIDQSIEYQFVANLVTLTLAYVIPIGAILVIYFRIFIAARSNSIKTRRNSSCSMTQEGVLSHNTVCNSLLNPETLAETLV